MDEFKDLEEVLSAAKKISEKLQVRKNFLTEEISRLRAENEKILAERNNLLVELNSLLAENERLRKVNEGFGENLRQINNLFRMFIGNDSRKNFTDSDSEVEENLISHDETEILDAEENLPANLKNSQPKKKMVFAEFYAEEVGFEENQNTQ